jgi:hypothetical protein
MVITCVQELLLPHESTAVQVRVSTYVPVDLPGATLSV